MSKFKDQFLRFASRFKLLGALGALFFSGALLATSVTAWHYSGVITRISRANDAQVARLEAQLDAEVRVNRGTLEVSVQQSATAIEMLTDLLDLARRVTSTANEAATTARKAAATAQGAANNAAQANISVREVAPARGARKQEFIEP